MNIFCGHGSPMNALSKNIFTDNFKRIGTENPQIKTIVCISAHWVTNSTLIQASKKPRQIYDFYGFPKELYNLIYNPIGDPEFALKIHNIQPIINLTEEWGVDHGSWSVLHHMYSFEDIKVLQLSLNKNLSLEAHFELANSLKFFRKSDIMFLASGNIVHNLNLIDLANENLSFDWASKFNQQVTQIILDQKLDNLDKVYQIFNLPNLDKSHPTIEHLLPLVYTLGLMLPNEKLKVTSSKIQNGSIAMTCFET